MWGGFYGRRRRRNSDEGFECSHCGEWCEFEPGDDYDNCGCCDNIFCNECFVYKCATCEEQDDALCMICEDCEVHSGCKPCSDQGIYYCEKHIEQHLRECNKASRTERIINTESHFIEENERKLSKLKEEIRSKEAKARQIERVLAESRERKAAAEAGLR